MLDDERITKRFGSGHHRRRLIKYVLLLQKGIRVWKEIAIGGPHSIDDCPTWFNGCNCGGANAEEIAFLQKELKKEKEAKEYAHKKRLEAIEEGQRYFQERNSARRIIAEVDDGLGNGADEEAWPPGKTRGEAVAMLRKLADVSDHWRGFQHKAKGGKRRKCPVQCGTCCADGKDVTCSKLGVDGCTLPEEERPAICNVYLCQAAQKVEELQAAIETECEMSDALFSDFEKRFKPGYVLTAEDHELILTAVCLCSKTRKLVGKE